MSPRLLLHLEGAAILAASVFAYQHRHGSWILFAALFLAPDVSMIGYLRNAGVGAATYNAIHTYVGPFLLAGFALWMAWPTALLKCPTPCHSSWGKVIFNKSMNVARKEITISFREAKIIKFTYKITICFTAKKYLNQDLPAGW